MVDETVIESVRTYLRAVSRQGIPVSFGVVFGSFAIGLANEWSDIDLVVISPRFDGQRNWDDIDLLWHATAHNDHRIEPIACGEKEWAEDDARTIIETARREGQRVDLEERPVVAKT